jgi:hypothetical protein
MVVWRIEPFRKPFFFWHMAKLQLLASIIGTESGQKTINLK